MTQPGARTDRVAQCGGCGANVLFEVASSRVRVCEYCRYVTVRTPHGYEGQGKVAEVIPTGARLALGASGRYEGAPFRLVGRVQLTWAQGAWDEWYAAFDDGRWGWVAEAQGRYYVSFRVSPRSLPPRASLRAGRSLMLTGLGPFVVSDVRQARYTSAVGELPEPFPLDGTPIHVIDLSGPAQAFATLDFGDGSTDTPVIFNGREVPLDELHIDGSFLLQQPKTARAKTLTCPACRAPLELLNPDEAMRASCTHCANLIDVGTDTPRVVDKEERPRLLWALGRRANFGGVEYRVAGWMRRATWVEGTRYPWEEYLLYNPEDASYRYLLLQNGHWSFVRPIAPGDVERGPSRVTWEGRVFSRFSSVDAMVERVWGEFPWAVERGEKVVATDYIAPPEGLSEERSSTEVNWSHARYVSPDEIEQAFGERQLKIYPEGVAALQPNPFTQADLSIRKTLKWTLGAAFAIFVLLGVRSSGTVLLDERFELTPGHITDGLHSVAIPEVLPGDPNHTAVVFAPPIEIARSGRNLQVTVDSTVTNSWVWVEGAFVDEDTGDVRAFGVESSEYSGRDSDGQWVENNRKQTKFLSAMPAGVRTLRLEAQWPKGRAPPVIHVKVRTNVVRFSHLFIVLLLLIAYPAYVAVRRAVFEGQRWEEASG